jgi:general stress protein 26
VRVASLTDDLNVLKKAWSRIEGFQHVFLATDDNGHPRVRPVTLISFEKRLWIATDTKSAKVKQIRKNPKLEFSFAFKEKDQDCCLRVLGIAKIVNEKAIKTKLAAHLPFFKEHWKDVDDPNYTLLEIRPREVECVTPEETLHVKFSRLVRSMKSK